MPGFDSIAANYDALADAPGRLAREGPLLERLLGAAPGRQVVDLACGTGLHAHYLAELGAEVTAFDLAPDMVKYAQEKRPHPHIAFRIGDMRCLEGGPWDVAFCLGNSLSLLESAADVAATFRATFAALAPGGFFLFQVLNYAAETAQQPRHRVERRTRDGDELIAVKSLVPCRNTTLLALSFFIDRGGRIESSAETAVLRHLTSTALAEAAESAGFRCEAWYGGFDQSPYVPDRSPDLIGVVLKPPG